jgi:hypothetical protein
MKKAADQSALQVFFGSVTIFMHLVNSDLGRFEVNYIRIDHEAINSDLRRFLDTCIPTGSHDVANYSIPREG